MVENLFNQLFPTAAIVQLKNNANYNFVIKHLVLEEYDCQLLFTEGLSQYPQKTKEGFEGFEKIELYFCLPLYWDLKVDQWPLYWLDRLAEIPQKNKTWFGAGDTIPAGNPPQILSDRFAANHFMLTKPIKLADLFSDPIFLNEGVQFLGVMPICQEELAYKLRNSHTILRQKLIKKNHTEQVDMFRTAVSKKRLFGLF